jgi:hypothetical protein
VLYMTGYPAAELMQAGALVPGIPVIQKPFTSEQLGRKMRELLTRPNIQ